MTTQFCIRISHFLEITFEHRLPGDIRTASMQTERQFHVANAGDSNAKAIVPERWWHALDRTRTQFKIQCDTVRTYFSFIDHKLINCAKSLCIVFGALASDSGTSSDTYVCVRSQCDTASRSDWHSAHFSHRNDKYGINSSLAVCVCVSALRLPYSIVIAIEFVLVHAFFLNALSFRLSLSLLFTV